MSPEITGAINTATSQTISWMRAHHVVAVALKETDILKWIILSGADVGGIGAAELDIVVQRVMNEYYNIRTPDHGLTVGALRAVIQYLPDSMPVFYERIDDKYFNEHGWSTVELKTGDVVNDSQQGVEAFSVAVATDENGKTALALTAHY